MLRLAIRVQRQHAEVALAELLTFAPSGVEEVDVDAGTVEYAVYGSSAELPDLPALRATLALLGEKLAPGASFSPSNQSGHPSGPGREQPDEWSILVDVSTTEVADDWSERWREFHKPLVLGSRLSVRPPWEPRVGTDIELVIDPGQAFGTGAHATTRLCLELLLECSEQSTPAGERKNVVDLGCGSGVLAITAAKLGWGPVLGLDHDQLAVDATKKNAQVNGVELSVRRFDLRDEQAPPAALMFANLLGPLLRAWCAQMASSRGERPRIVIASGLLVTEADGIATDFARLGYAETARRTRGEWAALLLELPAQG